MDTKVEQELFGYDPSDPDGLDALHSHIHADFEELELKALAAEQVPSGVRAGESVFLGTHAQNMAGLSSEQRHAYKQAHYLELYGSPSNLGQTS